MDFKEILESPEVKKALDEGKGVHITYTHGNDGKDSKPDVKVVDNGDKTVTIVRKLVPEVTPKTCSPITLSNGCRSMLVDGFRDMVNEAEKEGYTKCTGMTVLAEFEDPKGNRDIKAVGAFDETDNDKSLLRGIMDKLLNP